MKQTVFKSITAIICVIAVCIASTTVFGKIGDAMVESAKYAPGSAIAANASPSADSSTDGSDASVDAPVEDIADVDTDTSSDTDASSSDETATSASSSSSQSSSSSSASKTNAANDPTKYTKAQIIAFYNDALKATAKAPRLAVTKSESISIVVDELSFNSDRIKKIINENVLSRYAKPTTEVMSFTNGVASDNSKAADFIPKAKLEPAGAKSAKITKSGSNYVVSIVSVAEKTTLTNPTGKYINQCGYPLNLAGVDLGSAIKITQADMSYSGVIIKATVNSKGLLVSSSLDQPLEGTGAGSIIGIKLSGSVHGGMVQNITYKY